MSATTTPDRPVVPGTEDHPHARAVLGAALAPGSRPSHAYLFHGPSGTGKAAAARAFAAELLAAGGADPESARHRALAGAHPDLTWVRPTGAHVMRVDDVEGPVVSAATRTPFESARRVFVLERVETMNDEVANRLLKTLEEPAPFVHLILLTAAPGQMLETVLSRCQPVRFDPLPPERIAAALEAEGVEPALAVACGRLALGSGARARELATPEGEALRAEVEAFVLAALRRDPGGRTEEPWRALFERADQRKKEAEAALAETARIRLELEPKGRERRSLEKEFQDAAKREGRRAHTAVLDLALTLAQLAFRDLACVAAGADAAVLGRDRIEGLARHAGEQDGRRLRAAVECCEETRASLELNVTEDLALLALLFRLRDLVGGPA